MVARTLGEALSTRDNAINAIRLGLASLVILSHHFIASGSGPSPMFGGYSLGGWAVMGFFAISGYLVTGSRLFCPLRTYLTRRAARIYPGFLACLVLTVAAFAPLAAFAEGESVHLWDALGYVVRNASLWIFQPGVANTLNDAPYPVVWNASAWTLAYEALGYVGIGLLLTFAKSPRARTMAVWASFTAATLGNAVVWGTGAANNVATVACWLGAFMVAGACVRMHADWVRAHPLLILAALGILLIAATTGTVRVLAPLPLAYILLSLGAVFPTRVGARNDVSYGVYIYAFPVQQVLATTTLRTEPALYLVVTCLATALLAVLSWSLIEKPAIGWAHRLTRQPRWARVAGP